MVKRQTFVANNQIFRVFQIINISNRIRFEKLIGEKNLLQMANACVSHEMRNPINSIHCQNVKMKDCISRLYQLIKGQNQTKLMVELGEIVNEMNESCKIQLASTKLLNFIVGDMLSLAQIDSNKFRKDCSVFNIKNSIEEVMMIQQHKAVAMGINLKLILNNLSTVEKQLICTDEQRLQ